MANRVASVSRVGQDQGFDDADLQRLSKQLAQSLDDNGEDEIPPEVIQQLEDAVQDAHLLQLLEQYVGDIT